jgi:hypothetical protein
MAMLNNQRVYVSMTQGSSHILGNCRGPFHCELQQGVRLHRRIGKKHTAKDQNEVGPRWKIQYGTDMYIYIIS